jgi:tRNA pseudouridine synthase 10
MPAATLLKEYRLCKYCLERHMGSGTSSSPCYICCGLMDGLDSITDGILSAVKDYEFDTFLIGATLAVQLHEREDKMRSRLKIRGTESIKNSLTRELGIRLTVLTGKKVEYIKPDVTILLTVDKDNIVNVSVISRPLTFAGTYVKKSRGLPQRQDKCISCGGKGCISCGYSGLSGHSTIEGIIANEVIQATGGQTPKFTWIGSEDESSLVLGTGRPFYVRVFNVKKRKLRDKKIKFNGIAAILNVINGSPMIQQPFKSKTRIYVKCENVLTKKNLKKLNSLSGSKVNFKNKSRMITKNIYSANIRQIDTSQFILTIVADGGLLIKQFVGGGEYMKPNISEILDAKCECVMFDILDVRLE